MFSRKSCYFFVRPKKSFLEVVRVPRPRGEGAADEACERPSKTKVAHIIQITHRDEVEAPITDWLREAYDFMAPAAAGRARKSTPASAKKKASR